MLKVTIELYPYGDGVKRRELSSFCIANDGTGTNEVGNYLFKKKGDAEWQPSVQNWYRAQPVEQLVRAVIETNCKVNL